MKSKLRISCYEWDFSDEEPTKEMGKDLGLCDYENLEIKVKKDTKSIIKKTTALHEILHAFFSSACYTPKDEERVVDILAPQIILFLENNKDFFIKYFLNGSKK